MNWFEPLPASCPPEEAVPADEFIAYRIAFSNPANEDDFKSHRMRFPGKHFSVGECRACSLSIYNDLDATKEIAKLPTFKDKPITFLKLHLRKTDGYVLPTGGPNHYSWWRSQKFDTTSIENVI